MMGHLHIWRESVWPVCCSLHNSSLQVHVLIEHCLIRGLDALESQVALQRYGVPPCVTSIGIAPDIWSCSPDLPHWKQVATDSRFRLVLDEPYLEVDCGSLREEREQAG